MVKKFSSYLGALLVQIGNFVLEDPQLGLLLLDLLQAGLEVRVVLV